MEWSATLDGSEVVPQGQISLRELQPARRVAMRQVTIALDLSVGGV